MNSPDRNLAKRIRRSRLTASWYTAMLIAFLPMQATAEGAAASEGLSKPLSVCVQENNPIAAALATLSGKPIHGRAFAVRYFDESPFLSSDCQILLVTNTSSKRQTALLEAISKQPVLTIVDNDHFINRGGIIGLDIQQNHVQFAINVTASKTAGLDISAQLLQLAKIMDNRQGT